MPSNKQKSLPHLSLCLGHLISHQSLLIQIAVVISLHIPSAWLFFKRFRSVSVSCHVSSFDALWKYRNWFQSQKQPTLLLILLLTVQWLTYNYNYCYMGLKQTKKLNLKFRNTIAKDLINFYAVRLFHRSCSIYIQLWNG